VAGDARGAGERSDDTTLGDEGRRTVSVDLAVIGLGYVGLPLAHAAVREGMTVLGFDVDETVVRDLGAGRSPVDDLSDADLRRMRDAGFRATSAERDLADSDSDVVAVCVPTPLTEDAGPDLGAVRDAMRTVARSLRPGMLVVLESTTYPGTTDEVIRPLLEQTGLIAGRDFNLAFSPERIDPGNDEFDLHNTPKVVGGHTPACTDRAAAFYGKFVDTVVAARGTREAETAKLLENTYRHVNIALVNEMARFCHELGIDLWDVIRCAATKPFGFEPFYPGPGVGGHCIPIDPNYLSHNVRAKLGYPFRFVELAQEINATMPDYVARRAQNLLNDHDRAIKSATVLLLGVTYKPDIADQRESPAVAVARRLRALGATVLYHDPHVRTWDLGGETLSRVDDLDTALQTAELTVVLQGHSDYDGDTIAAKALHVLDTRGITPRSPTVEHI
jgi:UDP-N-acetyl-D-glucosamine dehydrogenase